MLGILDEEPTKFEKWLSQKLGKGIDKVVMGVAVFLAIVLSLGLFFLLPELFARLLKTWMPNQAQNWLINLLSGIFRIMILIAYIAFCAKVPDVRRTFEYHGAEHKTVYCHEHDLPLTPENAQQFSTLHPRCGTSFLLIVMLISIVFFLFIRVDSRILQLVLRLLLIPVIAGVSYEFIRLAGRYDNRLVNILSKPGLWMQKMTTKEPDDEMIEVGIASVEAVFDWKKYQDEIRAEEPDAFSEGATS